MCSGSSRLSMQHMAISIKRHGLMQRSPTYVLHPRKRRHLPDSVQVDAALFEGPDSELELLPQDCTAENLFPWQLAQHFYRISKTSSHVSSPPADLGPSPAPSSAQQTRGLRISTSPRSGRRSSVSSVWESRGQGPPLPGQAIRTKPYNSICMRVLRRISNLSAARALEAWRCVVAQNKFSMCSKCVIQMMSLPLARALAVWKKRMAEPQAVERRKMQCLDVKALQHLHCTQLPKIIATWNANTKRRIQERCSRGGGAHSRRTWAAIRYARDHQRNQAKNQRSTTDNSEIKQRFDVGSSNLMDRSTILPTQSVPLQSVSSEVKSQASGIKLKPEASKLQQRLVDQLQVATDLDDQKRKQAARKLSHAVESVITVNRIKRVSTKSCATLSLTPNVCPSPTLQIQAQPHKYSHKNSHKTTPSYIGSTLYHDSKLTGQTRLYSHFFDIKEAP